MLEQQRALQAEAAAQTQSRVSTGFVSIYVWVHCTSECGQRCWQAVAATSQGCCCQLLAFRSAVRASSSARRLPLPRGEVCKLHTSFSYTTWPACEDGTVAAADVARAGRVVVTWHALQGADRPGMQAWTVPGRSQGPPAPPRSSSAKLIVSNNRCRDKGPYQVAKASCGHSEIWAPSSAQEGHCSGALLKALAGHAPCCSPTMLLRRQHRMRERDAWVLLCWHQLTTGICVSRSRSARLPLSTEGAFAGQSLHSKHLSNRLLLAAAVPPPRAYVSAVTMLSAARSSSHRLPLPFCDTLRAAAAARCLLGPTPTACAAEAAAEPALVYPPQQVQQNQRQDWQQQQQQQAQQQQPAAAAAKMERKPLAPPGYSRTFYKRQLPSPPAIEFASERGEEAGDSGRHSSLALTPDRSVVKNVPVKRRRPPPSWQRASPFCSAACAARTLALQRQRRRRGSPTGTGRCLPVPWRSVLHPDSAQHAQIQTLPGPCPAAATSAGKKVFAEALAAGTMNNFFKLIEQFRTQVSGFPCNPCPLRAEQRAVVTGPPTAGHRRFAGAWRAAAAPRAPPLRGPAGRSRLLHTAQACPVRALLAALAVHRVQTAARPAVRIVQDEPAYCGLSSLAMTLNTLSIDPRRTWKGPWRWWEPAPLPPPPPPACWADPGWEARSSSGKLGGTGQEEAGGRAADSLPLGPALCHPAHVHLTHTHPQVSRGDAGLLPPAAQSAGGGHHAHAGAAGRLWLRRAVAVALAAASTHAAALQ